jgi:hypothetical protein
MRRGRSHWGSLAAGGVVIAAGFAVAGVELLGFPKGSVWGVAAAALLLVLLIRRLTR